MSANSAQARQSTWHSTVVQWGGGGATHTLFGENGRAAEHHTQERGLGPSYHGISIKKSREESN